MIQNAEFTGRSLTLFGVTCLGPGRRTARARLARWVAAAAVLVGLVVLPCADGMMMTGAGHADHGVTSEMVAGDGGAVPMVAADAGAPGSRHLGGLLGLCMVFLVVAAVVGLRPGGPRAVVGMPRRARVPGRRAVGPGAPSLAELCLLRT